LHTATDLGRPIPDITAYNELRDCGEPLTPLPAQLVVLANYTHASPTIITALEKSLTAGRATGINLLFAAHTAGDANLLASRLTYCIALRTATVQDSHDVIGSDEAAQLPPTQPGLGYLRIGQTVIGFRTTPPMASPNIGD
jgi:hypothetical protein